MEEKPTTHTPESIQDFLSEAIAKAELAAATCVGIHRATESSQTPEKTSKWHPFNTREEWQEFDAALDRWLEKRASQKRSAA